MREKLIELEENLKHHSHDQTAIEIVQNFAQSLGKTRNKQVVFGSDGVLLHEPPITYQEVVKKGLISQDEDPFSLLQGDIVSTDAAYFFGERLLGMKFIIASSTCDLVENRRENAVLFRIQPLNNDDKTAASTISELLRFKSTKLMYLPRLKSDTTDVIANLVLLDGVVQIHLNDLHLATRHASLGLTGWRIFGALLKTVMARTGESEVKIRTSIF
jgi:hypothetical protein